MLNEKDAIPFLCLYNSFHRRDYSAYGTSEFRQVVERSGTPVMRKYKNIAPKERQNQNIFCRTFSTK